MVNDVPLYNETSQALNFYGAVIDWSLFSDINAKVS